jgi:hypothetical protein
MFNTTNRFSPATRTRLERTVAAALKRRTGESAPLRRAVLLAVRELREEGLDLAATLSVLGAVVEDAGRACGADRPSLFTREPLWLSVRRVVFAEATAESHEFRELAVVG